MKSLKILCSTIELHCFFPNAKLLNCKNINKDCNELKIISQDEVIDILHYKDDLFKKIEIGLENLFNIDSIYINPVENLTIICDRYLWYRFYLPLLKDHKELFDKLEEIYVEKNVKVFFSFAILEAVNYEDEEEYFLYDFKFKHIKTSDYELFKDKKNFYYDSFYNMFHLFAEGQMTTYLYPNIKHGFNEYHIDFSKIFTNFNINNRLNRPYLYSHTCLKPRYHRIQFLLQADKYNVLRFGINNVNKQFIEEYKEATDSGYIWTDSTKRHNENHKKYFNKDWYDSFLKIKHKINITPDDPSFLYDHMLHYYKGEEYNESYIDVAGETHCIFDLKYGFFTEKSIKPIMSEKFAMIYGSKKVYEEYKRIGIDLFLEEFGLNGIENKNELEQIDMIVQSLNNFSNGYNSHLQSFYIKNYDKIKNNKQKLFDYYCKIMNKINTLFLDDKKPKLV